MSLPLNIVCPKNQICSMICSVFLHSDGKEMEAAALSGGCPLLVSTGSGMLDRTSSELQGLLTKEPFSREVWKGSEHPATGTACPLLGFQQLRLFLKTLDCFFRVKHDSNFYIGTMSFQQTQASPAPNHKVGPMLFCMRGVCPSVCTCVMCEGVCPSACMRVRVESRKKANQKMK